MTKCSTDPSASFTNRISTNLRNHLKSMHKDLHEDFLRKYFIDYLSLCLPMIMFRARQRWWCQAGGHACWWWAGPGSDQAAKPEFISWRGQEEEIKCVGGWVHWLTMCCLDRREQHHVLCHWRTNFIYNLLIKAWILMSRREICILPPSLLWLQERRTQMDQQESGHQIL